MQRGTSNRGTRGVSTATRGSSFRGRGRGAAQSGSSSKFFTENLVEQHDSLGYQNPPKRPRAHQRRVKVDPPAESSGRVPFTPYTPNAYLKKYKNSKQYTDTTPQPTADNSFAAERNANAARKEHRGKPRGGSASLRGTPEARGAFRNKTVRFESPAQQNAAQKPFVIPKKPGSEPAKSKLLHQTFTAPPSDPDAHTAKIKKALEQNGLASYPNWPTAQPGDPSQKAVIKGFWTTTKAYRAKVRTLLMNNGLIDDPDIPKKLSEAIDFKGTCDGMCPMFEQITRIMEHDVKNAEKEMAFDGSLWPAPQKMIKAYGRSSAGQDAPLPSDIRTPAALRKTLDYLIQEVLGEKNHLPTVHNFLWDRTRSIRRDFTFQQASLTQADYLDEVYCLEKIARLHVVALHQMSDPSHTSDDFSEHQEVEQLGRTLLSLIHTYEDCKAQGIRCENEAEFRAYFVIYHARNPAMMEAVQDWGKEFWANDDIQTATALVECLHNIWEINGPLKPHSASDIALNMYSRFFKIIQQPEVSYTTACFAEIHFNSVRKTSLMTILSAYRKQRDQTTDWTLSALNSYLHFDSPLDVEDFVEAHGLHIKDGAGEAYLDFDSGSSLMEPETKIKQPHSKKLVEVKRGHKSLPSCIYSNAFATGNNAQDGEDPNSLFVGGCNGSNQFIPAQRPMQQDWEPSVEDGVLKAPPSVTMPPVLRPEKRFGGFIDTDDESATTPSIFSSTAGPAAPTPSFGFGTPQGPPTTSFFPPAQANNGTSTSTFSQPNKPGTTSSIFEKQPVAGVPNSFSFPSAANQSQPAPPTTTTPPSIFPQPTTKAPATSFFGNPQQMQAATTNGVTSGPSIFGSTGSPTPKPSATPPTTQAQGSFSFLSQGTTPMQPTPLFAPKTASTESPSPAPASPSAFFPTGTQAPKAPSPFMPTTTPQGTNIFAPAENSSSGATPFFPTTGQTSVTGTTANLPTGQASQPSSVFASTGSGTAPAVSFSSPFAPKPAEKPSNPPTSEAQKSIFPTSPVAGPGKTQSHIQQPAVSSFGSIGNHAVSTPTPPVDTPSEEVRYNWLAPPASSTTTKPTIFDGEKSIETPIKPPTPTTTSPIRKPAASPSRGKTVISNFAPFLADWAALGEGGILDQFTASAVEKACREAYDEYHNTLEANAVAVIEEDKQALREADHFRQTFVGQKYFYLWRINAHKLWQRRRGRQARELRKEMAEQHAASMRAATENIVEDFSKSVTSSKNNKRKSEEDMLAASGVLSGVRDSTTKIRKIVRGNMAPPQLQRSTTPVGSPPRRDVFGRSTSALGHSTSSLQSLVNGDHPARQSAIGGPRHGASHQRRRSESMRKDIPLNMSVGGSRIHLLPPTWNPEDDKGPKPNNVQTDYFRLKARGIHTLPNGTPLASTAAVHLRPSLIDSVRQSLSASGGSGSGTGPITIATPDRRLKRSVSQFSQSAPPKRLRADPAPKPNPNHSQEMEEIKANARRIMNNDASKRRREEERRQSLEREATKDEEMEELFRRSRKLKEDMEKGEEWYRMYNDSWSRSASGSAAPPAAKAAPAPTSAPRNVATPQNRRSMREPEVIELD